MICEICKTKHKNKYRAKHWISGGPSLIGQQMGHYCPTCTDAVQAFVPLLTDALIKQNIIRSPEYAKGAVESALYTALASAQQSVQLTRKAFGNNATVGLTAKEK